MRINATGWMGLTATEGRPRVVVACGVAGGCGCGFSSAAPAAGGDALAGGDTLAGTPREVGGSGHNTGTRTAMGSGQAGRFGKR